MKRIKVIVPVFTDIWNEPVKEEMEKYKDDAIAFINVRDKGVEEGFVYAQEQVNDLIAKVEKVKGLKNEPVFKNCIYELIGLYNLK